MMSTPKMPLGGVDCGRLRNFAKIGESVSKTLFLNAMWTGRNGVS